MKDKLSEAMIQKSVVDYLNAVLLPGYKCIAIPNASRRTASGRASNAVAGLTPGAPDLVILGNSKAFLIEVKSSSGKLSEAQELFGDWAVTKGLLAWAVCRSVDEVRIALESWGIPTRESKNG